MSPDLAKLLRRVRDGDDSAMLLAEVRTRLLAEPAVPDDLVADVLDDDPAEGAGVLLGMFGVDDMLGELLATAVRVEAGASASLATSGAGEGMAVTEEDLLQFEARTPWPIAQAVRAEAGSLQVDHGVCERIGVVRLPVAEAVIALAGEVEVSPEVAKYTGVPVHPIAAAIQSEAGEIDISSQVAAHMGLHPSEISEAVRAMAGAVDIAEAVMGRLQSTVDHGWVSAMLDRELSAAAHSQRAEQLAGDAAARELMSAFADVGRSVRNAVAEEAGEVGVLWAGVASAIGIADPEHVAGYDGAVVAEAVRAEAGEIEIWASVFTAIRPPVSTVVSPDVPAPANGNWAWAGLVAAAVALIAVMVGVPFSVSPVAPTQGGALIEFAHADEIKVDDLHYAENTTVQVFQSDEGQGPLIIWVDEETTL